MLTCAGGHIVPQVRAWDTADGDDGAHVNGPTCVGCLAPEAPETDGTIVTLQSNKKWLAATT